MGVWDWEVNCVFRLSYSVLAPIVSHQETESVSMDRVCQSYTEHLLHLQKILF